MANSDPRSQLYNVTRASLEKLEQDFHNQKLDKVYKWTKNFTILEDQLPMLDFTDPNSTIEADKAKLLSIYARDVGKLVIALSLYKDESPYCREEDKISLNTEIVGGYDIHLPPEGPATIIPAGFYESADQTPNDLYKFYKAGISEVVGVERSINLISTINKLSIEQMDFNSLDLN